MASVASGNRNVITLRGGDVTYRKVNIALDKCASYISCILIGQFERNPPEVVKKFSQGCHKLDEFLWDDPDKDHSASKKPGEVCSSGNSMTRNVVKIIFSPTGKQSSTLKRYR